MICPANTLETPSEGQATIHLCPQPGRPGSAYGRHQKLRSAPNRSSTPPEVGMLTTLVGFPQFWQLTAG
jgi:hypothetical protein